MPKPVKQASSELPLGLQIPLLLLLGILQPIGWGLSGAGKLFVALIDEIVRQLAKPPRRR